jgi:glycerol-3-phosphate acyltransferase PlsY
MSIAAIAWLAGAYLLGSVPFGLLFARLLADVDVRSVGSGNIGATNVLRAAGRSAAVLTLIADCLKGLVPVLIAPYLASDASLPVLTGIAAVAGHNFPVYLGFKGGKGVATSFGVVLAVSPWIGLVCLLAWLGSALLWRYSSLAALVAFAVFPLATFATAGDDIPRRFLAVALFALIYYRHRENIKRLLAGNEPKIGKKA